MTWKNSICMSIGRVACPDVNTLVCEIDDDGSSPIDAFYDSTGEILTKVPRDLFQHSDDLAGLLFVGLISSTENYFRDALGNILAICPISQSHSSDEKVQLGSLLWAHNGIHNRSAFEFMAFSNAENVKKTFHNFLRYQIKANGLADGMLKEYDQLCELRHAVVHSGQIVAGKNALKLGLKRCKKSMKVRITYGTLQGAGKVCTALVQAVNNELFEMLVTRWAEDWRKLPSWSSDEEALLVKIRSICLSKRDTKNKAVLNPQSQKKLLAQVKASFNL